MCDCGPGISEDHLERIFQPFFTTKPGGKGTGLGLPIVKTILDRHGATLTVDSSAEAGTTFLMTFPACPTTHSSDDRPVAEAASAAANR